MIPVGNGVPQAVPPYTAQQAAKVAKALWDLAEAYDDAGCLDEAAETRRDARWFERIAKGDPDPPR